MKNPAHVEKAERYARSVIEGRTPACRWVRLACQRHFDDKQRSLKKTYGYRFDVDKAEAACRFVELLPHVKGHWAIPDRGGTTPRVVLQPFQCFERAMLFGWVRKESGLRRFRIAYIERPRKNGKSVDAAATGLYMLTEDGEFGAEVYSGATSEKQAWEVFRPAHLMAKRTPEFLEAYGVQVNAKSLAIPANGNRFEPVIGKPGDGASPSCSITDEYHEHPDSTQFDTMVTGMGARQQPLALVITTAGENIESPCYALHEQTQKMLDGSLPDDSLFGIIYTIDEGDDWTTEEALRKANPNFGVSVDADYLRGQQRAAVNDARKQAIFKTKHLDVWVTARSPWMNMEWWHRQADRTLKIETFTGDQCWASADLANRLDLVSSARLFRRRVDDAEHYYFFGYHYCPEVQVALPEKRHYQGWARDGYLIATEGNDTDLARITEDLDADRKRCGILGVGIDPWNSQGLEDRMKGIGLKTVEIPQTVSHFSEPMKQIEALVKDGRFHHDGNPCMTWMIGNVTVKPDAKDNIFPRKERRENKIDGPVALFMAMRLAMVGPKVSVYEDPAARPGGLLVVDL